MGAGQPGRRGRVRVCAAAALGAAALALPAAGAHATALAGPTGSVSAAGACGGRISLRSSGRIRSYAVRIDRGKVTCGQAKRALRTYLIQSVSPRGWLCFRGHASQHQTWAAACATPGGANVKAFPVKT